MIVMYGTWPGKISLSLEVRYLLKELTICCEIFCVFSFLIILYYHDVSLVPVFVTSFLNENHTIRFGNSYFRKEKGSYQLLLKKIPLDC